MTFTYMRKPTYGSCKKWIFISLFCCVTQAYAEPNLLHFTPGEVLKYQVHFGWITLGKATLKVSKKTTLLDEVSCYQVEVNAATTGVANWLVRVKDKWGTYWAADTHVPQRTYAYQAEGSYRRNEVVDYRLDQKQAWVKLYDAQNKTVIEEKTFPIVAGIQDIVSVLYYLRGIDYGSLQSGDLITLPFFYDGVFYPNAQVKFVGKERVKTKYGFKNTWAIVPLVPEGAQPEDREDASIKKLKNLGKQKKKEDLAAEVPFKVWFTDDKERIPVQMKLKLFLGSVVVTWIR